MNQQVEDYDVAELFSYVFGIEPTGDDANMAVIEETIGERYGIDLETMTSIISDLLPFCAEGRSALSGIHYRGFAADGSFIIKRKVAAQP